MEERQEKGRRGGEEGGREGSEEGRRGGRKRGKDKDKALGYLCANGPTECLAGSILTPALPPPKGTSTMEHLKVISVARAFTSSSQTSML